MRVVAIVNSGAGSGSAGEIDAEELRRLFQDAGIEADVRIVPGEQVGEVAEEAVRSGPPGPPGIDAVVAGGGDGTIRAVATRLAGGPIPLGVLPVGTLNHFARDLGIPVDLPGAIQVIAEGKLHALDVGEVNGEIFINNSVLGFYPPVVKVRDRERHEMQRGKWAATISAAFKVLPRHPPLRIRVRAGEDDLVRETLFAFIGNNEYEMSAFSYGARSRLDSGNLYLYIAKFQGRLGLLGLLFLSLFRDVKGTDRLDCLSAPELTIEMEQRTVPVYLDGEVTVLETPLRYRNRVRDLRVILPAEGEPSASRG
ncbi:MAG TPA: diacylglycerol kinase family protein [Thermoanaerobaculia bacterium]|jgi:diacylglycerol kinase family enzyme|nr:diacylglycerol kinase family protein [Thermoanaerobaculia bacterium]